MKQFTLKNPPPPPVFHAAKIKTVLANVNGSFNIYLETGEEANCSASFMETQPVVPGNYLVVVSHMGDMKAVVAEEFEATMVELGVAPEVPANDPPVPPEE